VLALPDLTPLYYRRANGIEAVPGSTTSEGTIDMLHPNITGGVMMSGFTGMKIRALGSWRGWCNAW